MYFDNYKDLSKIYKEKKNAFYEIKLIEEKEPSSLKKMMNPEYSGQLDQTIVVLRDLQKREIVMSDSWMEQQTNIDFVKKAKGDVLIAGLGIGMIVLAIQDKPEVTSITVVEIDENLKDFIMETLGKHLNDKVKIFIADINCYSESDMFDTIYCDIWNEICSDNFTEMEDLDCSLSLNLKDDGTIGHWRKRKCMEMWQEDNGLDEEEFY